MPSARPEIDCSGTLAFSRLFVWFGVEVLDLPAMLSFAGGI